MQRDPFNNLYNRFSSSLEILIWSLNMVYIVKNLKCAVFTRFYTTFKI